MPGPQTGSFAYVTRPASLYHEANYRGPDLGYQPIFPILSSRPAEVITESWSSGPYISGAGWGPGLQQVNQPGAARAITGGGGGTGFEEWTGEEDQPMIAQGQNANWLGLALLIGALFLLKK